VTYVDRHTVPVAARPDEAWGRLVRLGGDPRAWTPGPLWRVRGALDRLVGGPGFRMTGPGRDLRPGDDVDFWRVEEVSPPALLRLRASTRLPGTAYLTARLASAGAASTLTLQTDFEPAGLPGHAYWWSSVAAHRATFALMARRWASLLDD